MNIFKQAKKIGVFVKNVHFKSTWCTFCTCSCSKRRVFFFHRGIFRYDTEMGDLPRMEDQGFQILALGILESDSSANPVKAVGVWFMDLVDLGLTC